MKFKIDENLPVELAKLLNDSGHEAITISEQSLGGRSDPDIVAICKQEGHVLITLDMDFSDIRTYPPKMKLQLCEVRRSVVGATRRVAPT